MGVEVDVEKAYLQAKKSEFNLKARFSLDNELAVLFGPSGAGKTLTLHAIAGLVKPDKGRIVVNGRIYFDSERNIDLSPQERRVGYVFQNYALFPHLTVEKNIVFGLKKRESLKEMLAFFGIVGLEKRYPNQISGGQQQRVALARALIIKPEILLLDEPFSALDQVMRMRLRIDLKKIQSEYGIPMLMITHNPVEAYTMADRLIVYSHGRVEQIGSPKEIFNKPKNRDIARLVGMNNIFKGVVLDVKEEEVLIQSHEKITALKISGLEIGEEIIWCIRPDQVMVLREDKYLGKAVAENLFSGKIIEVIPSGASYLLFLEGALNLETEIPAHAFERLNLMVGKIIRVSLKKSAIHIIKEKE